MCRIAAYVGPPQPLDTLLYGAPHSLSEQAYAPREQLYGNVNVDGTGVAWWPDTGGGPVRYASTSPPWSDDNLRELAPALRAPAMVAAVRGATPGMPGGRAAVAPFVAGRVAVAHNGWLDGFRDGVGPRLIGELPPRWLTELAVPSDSLVIALHLAARLVPDADLLDTVAATLRHVAAVCREAKRSATLNLVVCDGQRLVASRASVDAPHNSLYVLAEGEPPWRDAALVASEPLDDRPWEPVPPDHLVEVRPGTCRLVPLDLLDLGALS